MTLPERVKDCKIIVPRTAVIQQARNIPSVPQMSLQSQRFCRILHVHGEDTARIGPILNAHFLYEQEMMQSVCLQRRIRQRHLGAVQDRMSDIVSNAPRIV